jgi:hypothetical protein
MEKDMPDVTSDAPNPPQNFAGLTASASEKFHIELQKMTTVYGVTNRHLSNDGKSFEDGGLEEKRDDQVHYYKETVPVVGKSGDFKATGAGKIEVIDKAQFDKETQAAVQANGNKLGIYIHGIRNAMGEPGEKAAEISADSGETFVVEDWASTASIKTDSWMGNLSNVLTQQRLDYQSSVESQGMINQSAEELADKFGANNIDIIGHSRGSYNEVRLLADMQVKGKAPVASAIFAHSDIDVGDFAHSLPDIDKATKHIDVLYSPEDSALGLSAMQKTGTADLIDGCTVKDSERLGKVGMRDQYLQNQASGLVGPGYFLSMQDIAKDDPNGHALTSKRVAEILTNPKIYQSKENEIKDGPQFIALDPESCKVALTNPPAPPKQPEATDTKKTEHTHRPAPLDPEIVQRDFVSDSPEVAAARAQRLASLKGEGWLPFDNIWASNTPTTRQQ